MRHIARALLELSLLGLLLVVCTAGDALAGPVGKEFRISTYTQGDQVSPIVAGLEGGGFVVTWFSLDQDGSGWGIYGQRYKANGKKAGKEFRVNTYKDDYQVYPNVAGLKGGGFVVTWQSNGQDGSDWGIYGQRYKATGKKAGKEFRVNTFTQGWQVFPNAAGLEGGGFVITWDSWNQDGSGYGVYGQRYKATGKKAGKEFRVNTYTQDYQEYSNTAGLAGGGFVVTWHSNGQDGSLDGVYGQRYNKKGKTVGKEFRVNTYTQDYQWAPSVAGLPGGAFVVVWASTGQDGSSDGVYGQRYNKKGKKVGKEFRVNTYKQDNQQYQTVAGLAGGGFVVTWQSNGQDGSGFGVYGQRYKADGKKAGKEFRVNTYTQANQGAPNTAGLEGGGFVVTWDSFGQDGSGRGIYGQRYK